MIKSIVVAVAFASHVEELQRLAGLANNLINPNCRTYKAFLIHRGMRAILVRLLRSYKSGDR
jgi:hypothetical protein